MLQLGKSKSAINEHETLSDNIYKAKSKACGLVHSTDMF